MKWKLEKLINNYNEINLDFNLDYESKLSKYDEIYDISNVNITGYITLIEEESFMFSINIKTDLKLACSVTLEEVDYKLDFNEDLIFSKDNQLDEDIFIIEDSIIDLYEPIFSLILLNIPMKIVKEGNENIYMSEEEAINVKKVNPAFQDLLNYFDDNSEEEK